MNKYTKSNLSSEQLHHFSKWTAKQKLDWLEEASKFVNSLPKRIRKLHERFRRDRV